MNSRSIFIPIIVFIFHELYWPISQNSVCRQHDLFDATGHILYKQNCAMNEMMKSVDGITG